MSTPVSGLFVGADGRVYDATDGMADTGLTDNPNRYARHGGLMVGADGNVYDIVRLLQNGAQASEMPEADAVLEGHVLQYIGETDEDFTLGHFYKCEGSGGVYAWTHIDFGATGLTATWVGDKLVLQ